MTLPKRSTKPRAAYHHGDLKNALLVAAKASIARDGAEALSVRALAQQAGVFHRAAYRHFADKDDLLAAVLAEAYRRLAARIEAEASSPEVALRLREIALAYASFAFEEPNMFHAMAGPRVNKAGAHLDLERALALAFAPTLKAMTEAEQRQEMTGTSPIVAALFFWAALQGILGQILHGRIKLRSNQRRQFICETADRLYAGLKFS